MSDIQIELDDQKINDFGRYFLCHFVDKLKEILSKEGVDEDTIRQAAFLLTDELATFFDYGWLKHEDEKLHPTLAFIERAKVDYPDIDTGKIVRVVLPELLSYHSEGGPECAVFRQLDNDDVLIRDVQFKAGLGSTD